MFTLGLIFASMLSAQEAPEGLQKDTVPRSFVCHDKWGDKACRNKVVGSLCNHFGEAGLCAVQSADGPRPECACLELAGDDWDHLVR